MWHPHTQHSTALHYTRRYNNTEHYDTALHMTRETSSQDRYRLLTVRQQWVISWLSRRRPNTRGLGRARPHTAVSATTMNAVSESAGHGRIRWRRDFVFPDKIENDTECNSNSSVRTKVFDSLIPYNRWQHPLTEVTPQRSRLFQPYHSCCRPTTILMGNRGILPICWERPVCYFDESYIGCTLHSINH